MLTIVCVGALIAMIVFNFIASLVLLSNAHLHDRSALKVEDVLAEHAATLKHHDARLEGFAIHLKADVDAIRQFGVAIETMKAGIGHHHDMLGTLFNQTSDLHARLTPIERRISHSDFSDVDVPAPSGTLFGFVESDGECTGK